MNITNELRDWMRTVITIDDCAWDIVDRIDENVKNIRFNEHQKGYQDGIRDGRSCEWDYWESTHIELPKDADGVPIRIGDVLDETDVGTYAFLPAKVVGYHECCGEVLPIVEHDGEFQVLPEKVCHYKPPTVEDVLREFAQAMNENLGMFTGEAIDADECRDADTETIAEYAEKLREVIEHVRD